MNSNEKKWSRENVGRYGNPNFNKNYPSGKAHPSYIASFTEKKFSKTQELSKTLDRNAVRSNHYTNKN